MHTEESKKNNLELPAFNLSRSVPVNALVAILRAGPQFPAKRNHAAGLVLRITQRNGSVRYETECSEIVYSVRIGPLQPKNSFLSAISTNPATIRIDNPPSGRGIDKLGSLRVLLKAVLTPDVT
jgi:hypothetical protein